MSEDVISDDQSHYEVSLTAGQAFLAFVLLLLSLAASFAFGLMIGKGQGDERLLAQSGPSMVTDPGAPTKGQERSAEFAVSEETPFAEAEAKPPVRQPAKSAARPASQAITLREEPAAAAPPPQTAARPAAGPAVPHYAQLLSTTDQTKAEALAARLIDGGFITSFVERGSNAKGPLFRVRVNFRSEQDARAAEPRLKAFSNEVWITRQ